MTKTTHTAMAHEYARAACRANHVRREQMRHADDGSPGTVYSPDAQRDAWQDRATYQVEYDRACSAMVWCDVRRIEYTDAADAVRIMRERTTVNLVS